MSDKVTIDLTGRYEDKIKENKPDADKIKEVKEYYYLYEYTDQVNLITDNPQYPSMLNYVKTGLLTEDEMIEALLHD